MVTKFQKNSLAWLIAATSLALTAHAQEKELAGTVLATRGSVNATDLVALEERALARRSQVFNVDRVLTGAGAQTQLRMSDNALLSLTENSELVIAEYQFNPATGEGKVAMELISGGLRTITGLVSPASEGNEYELRTGAATIGIRGTTYEVRRVGGETFMAVWDGEIEIRVGDESGPSFVLGGDQEFAFASINEDGEVTFYVSAPDVFADEEDDQEESTEEDESESDDDEQSEQDESDDENNDSDDSSNDDSSNGQPGEDNSNDNGPGNNNDGNPNNSVIVNRVVAPPWGTFASFANFGATFTSRPTRPTVVIDPLRLPTPPNVVAAKQGSVTYNNLVSYSINEGFDYQMSLSFEVNFSAGTINGGALRLVSPTQNSEWNAWFDGGISGNQLQGGLPLNTNMNFNVADHFVNGVEYDATGFINGTFHGSSAQQVRGAFSLTDSQNTSVSGNYQVRQ